MEKKKWVEQPGELALCRRLTDGDLVAAVLLHRIGVMWKLRKNKLKRFEKEWLAMSRDEWARSAGLTSAEMKDRALPQLRKHCSSFVEIRAMKLTPDQPKMLWISLDWTLITDEEVPWDMYEMALNGLGIFPRKNAYPFKAAAE